MGVVATVLLTGSAELVIYLSYLWLFENLRGKFVREFAFSSMIATNGLARGAQTLLDGMPVDYRSVGG